MLTLIIMVYILAYTWIKLIIPQFCQVFSPQTQHKCSCSHPLYFLDSNHTHPLMSCMAIVTALSRQPLTQTGINTSPSEMGAVQGKRTVLSTRLCIGGQQWPTQSQPRCFQSGAQRRPCCLHPSGASTHHPSLLHQETTLTLAKNHGCEPQEEEDQQPAATPRHNYLHTPAIGLYGFLALLALTKHYMRRSSALDCRSFLAATTLPLCVAGFYGNTYTNTTQAGKGAYFHYKRPHKMCIAL